MSQLETALFDVSHEVSDIGETGLNFCDFQLTAEMDEKETTERQSKPIFS